MYPAKKHLQQYRVLITTLITASRLVSVQFPIDHFTHIFIDEAGHCMEPESLVAIAGEGAQDGLQVQHPHTDLVIPPFNLSLPASQD